MSSTPRIKVEIKDATLEDLPVIAQGNIDTLAPFHDEMEFQPHLPDRIERQAARLAKLLSLPSVQIRKAVLPSTPDIALEDQGKLVGVALWMFTSQGQKPVNLKRRMIEGEEDEEKEIWKGLDWEKWNAVWDEWDKVRDLFMRGREHWYLVPLWVLPQYAGQGIGRLLLSEKIAECDSTTPSTPIYLEASKEGKYLYPKLGFVQYGESYYEEMVRWGKGNEEGEKWCEEKKMELLRAKGKTEFSKK